jgi:hypothetical protein
MDDDFLPNGRVEDSRAYMSLWRLGLHLDLFPYRCFLPIYVPYTAWTGISGSPTSLRRCKTFYETACLAQITTLFAVRRISQKNGSGVKSAKCSVTSVRGVRVITITTAQKIHI